MMFWAATQVRAWFAPKSPPCSADCLKEMLPATTTVLSTERISAPPASDIAARTVSAMMSTMPCWRRGVRCIGIFVVSFMDGIRRESKSVGRPESAGIREPDEVAHRGDRLERLVAVALPVGIGRQVEGLVVDRPYRHERRRRAHARAGIGRFLLDAAGHQHEAHW